MSIFKNEYFEFVNNEKENDEDYVYLDEEFELCYSDQPAEIALCVLSALNVGEIKSLDEIEGIMMNTVRALDQVIEKQDYPVKAAEKMLKRRSLGIGITNLAYYFAKNGVRYGDKDSLELIDELMEYVSYYAIKASMELAKEKGPCEWFHKTKYSQGIFPIDTYKKSVDNLIKRKPQLDWKWLKEQVAIYGMRNSTVLAGMPCESSSVVQNCTNGFEFPRALITTKKSKQGLLKVVVPEISRLKNKYTFAFSDLDLDPNEGLNKVYAVAQKWMDQGISCNHYYDFTKYPEGNLPLSKVAKDILGFYKLGGKMIYYANSYDGKTDDFSDIMDDNCVGGACSI